MKNRTFREAQNYVIIILLGVITLIISLVWLEGDLRSIGINIGAALVVTPIVYFILYYFNPSTNDVDLQNSKTISEKDKKGETLPSYLIGALKDRQDTGPRTRVRDLPEARIKRKK